MPLAPLRDLGQVGVITDVDPLLLPPNAWTMGVNARFDAKGISRGPVFKLAGALALNTSPRYAIGYRQLIGSSPSEFLVCNDDGTINFWAAGGTGQPSVETAASPSDWTPETYPAAYTSAVINDIVYVNRSDRVPWYMTTTGTQFAELPNWDPTWRCAAMRTCAGVLVALNVTKGATNYPTMVKSSDYMTYGSVPGSWTATTTNSATENIIPDMPEALVDGLSLRDRLILYTLNYTWLMEPTYDNNMFSYQRLFSNAGMISQNCGVEIDNIHYVFGNDDIWQHDGYTRKSLANLRVRDFIFENVVRSEAWQFFVMHNQKLSEIQFCYVSRDQFCHFPALVNNAYPGCNRAAVYNYRSDTWQFYDLPYIRGFGLGVGVAGSTYSGMGGVQYTQVGGTYSSYGDASKLSVLTIGPHISPLVAGVRSFEKNNSLYDVGVQDLAANAPVYIENQYIDLDGISDEIRAYKVITRLYPTARFGSTSSSLTFSLAASDYASTPVPVYGDPMIYDGQTNYQLDYVNAGRYMSIKVTYNDTNDFLLTGLDADYTITGHR